MKTPRLALCLLVSFVATTARAGDNTKVAAASSAKDDKAGQPADKSVQLTGSYIKRRVTQRGQITDGPYQVVVIDRAMIQRSGARDIKQILARYGAGR